MVDITALNGTVLTIDDNAIIMVAGPLPDDPPDSCRVTGPAPSAVAIGETAQHLLGRLTLMTPLAQLTRPDGSSLWIKGSVVSEIRPPLSAEIPDGEQVGAVLTVGGCYQAVEEDVATTRQIVNQHGGPS